MQNRHSTCNARQIPRVWQLTGQAAMIVLCFERNSREYEIDLLSKCRFGLRQLLGRNSRMPIWQISPSRRPEAEFDGQPVSQAHA